MKTIYTFVLCALLLSGCATTVPTVEEGWVPLGEWNRRVKASHRMEMARATGDGFKEALTGQEDYRLPQPAPGSGVYIPRTRVTCYSSRYRTSCYSSTR